MDKNIRHLKKIYYTLAVILTATMLAGSAALL